MKTTVEIADELLTSAKVTAKREQTTLRSLVDEGLRAALARRQRPAEFRLRRASFRGKGLQPGIDEGSWERVRELIYEGRGG